MDHVGQPHGDVVRHSERRDVLTSFGDLGAHSEISEALTDAGIHTPFPIQEMAIPIALTGTDLIAQARTGTGKTLAFGVPLLQRMVAPHDREFDDLDAAGRPQVLVITPTRELALQVTADLATAGERRGARVLTVYGGVPYEPQLEALEAGTDVVVGTPGRLLDLADRGALALWQVKALVLDEADRMLDLGFLPDVERLIQMTHELRQTMLFSATMPGDIVQLARRHMRHPINVRAEAAEESQIVPATAQFVYRTHGLDKPETMARVLQAEDRGRVIIFCTTKRATAKLTEELAERGFASAAIHGDLGQGLREKELRRFRDGKVDVLVATDVAARGIDIEGVTHVINYTCPDDDSTYLHRIGRTGRAGATGVAITFVDWSDLPRWKVINTSLDLPFDEPPETYSTSDHLHSDLGIPKDATGQVGPPRRGSSGAGRSGRRPAGRRDQRRGTSRQSDGSRDGDASRAGDASRDGDNQREPAGSSRSRKRQRRRLRGGVPVDRTGAETSNSAESTAQTGHSESAGHSEQTGHSDGAGSQAASDAGSSAHPSTSDTTGSADSSGSRSRRRRRRRRGRTSPSGPSSQGPS